MNEQTTQRPKYKKTKRPQWSTNYRTKTSDWTKWNATTISGASVGSAVPLPLVSYVHQLQYSTKWVTFKRMINTCSIILTPCKCTFVHCMVDLSICINIWAISMTRRLEKTCDDRLCRLVPWELYYRQLDTQFRKITIVWCKFDVSAYKCIIDRTFSLWLSYLRTK